MSVEASILYTRLYARIRAIESDLRNFVKQNLQESFLENESITSKAKERYWKEKKVSPNEKLELVDYWDFGDLHQVLSAKKDELREDIKKEFINNREKLELILSTRNRVMHHRPLEADDYFTVEEFVQQASNLWPETKGSLKISISELDSIVPEIKPNNERVIHNLPPDPDFNETGFIGRVREVKELKKLLYSHNQIITLFGEGGIGKTALMLKTAHDMRYDEDCPFEWIIWLTCKTTMLTNEGVGEIEDAIKDFKFLAQGIDASYRNVPKKTTLAESIESILEDAKEVKGKSLLILDNLEDLQSQKEVKDFLSRYKEFGTIAITSRIGLGEQDLPKKLDPMTEKDATKLFRDFAQLLGVDELYKLRLEKIQEYVRKLSLNPLGIKWFIQAVASGSAPDDVLNNKDILLDYCLANVYKKLNDEQKTFLYTLLLNGRPTSKEELLFYTEKENDIGVNESLQKLASTSLIKRTYAEDSDEYVYNITDFAREYVLTNDPPSEKLDKEITNKRDKASGLRQNMKTMSEGPYHPEHIEIRTDSESFLAIKLSEALRDSKKERWRNPPLSHEAKRELRKEVIKKVKEVQQTQPRYVEAYKISALLYLGQGNHIAAELEYKKALEIEPENPRILYTYAGFLLRRRKDTEKAKEYAERAFQKDGRSFSTIYLYAKCIGVQGEYDKAIEILKDLLGEKRIIREKNMALTDIVDFYKRKVEYKKHTEKDAWQAWNIFLEGVSLFEENWKQNKLNPDKKERNKFPDKKVRDKFVELLLEGMQCREDDEGRINKLMELVRVYIGLIQDHKRGFHLEKFYQDNSSIQKP